MSISVVNNQTKKSVVDPLREALVAALRDAKEANGAVARQQQAMERLRSRIHDELPRAIKKAEDGVAEAQRLYVSALANAAADDGPTPGSGVKAAKQAVQDAQEEMEAQKAALAQLRAVLPIWENEAREKEVAVEKAISLILAHEVQPLIERARKILREFKPYRDLFNALLSGSLSSHAYKANSAAISRGREPFDEAITALNRVLNEARAVDGQFPEVWDAARDRLRSDPHAVLPNFAELA